MTKKSGLKTKIIFLIIGILLMVGSFQSNTIPGMIAGAIIIGIVLSTLRKKYPALNQIVYITRNGRKYHTNANCKTLQSSGMTVQTTVAEAIQNGLSPYGKCS
jgi:hypothetical protein